MGWMTVAVVGLAVLLSLALYKMEPPTVWGWHLDMLDRLAWCLIVAGTLMGAASLAGSRLHLCAVAQTGDVTVTGHGHPASSLDSQEHTDINDRLSSTAAAQALQAMGTCFIAIDGAWRIIGANRLCAAWARTSVAALDGRDFHQLSAGRSDIQALVAGVMNTGIPAGAEIYSSLRPDRVVLCQIFPLTDGIGISFRDATEALMAAQRSMAQVALLQATLDALQRDITVCDIQGHVLAANAGWQAKNLRLESLLGPAAGLGSEDQHLQSSLRSFLDGQEPVSEYTYATQDGLRWHKLRMKRFALNQICLVAIAHEDITDAVKARDDMRDAAERQLAVQQQERRRIAVELHDSTGQHLVAASLGMTRLTELLAGAPATAAIIDDVRLSIREAQREIRSTSYLLHPPNVAKDGLERALRKFAEGFSRRAGLTMALRMRGDLRDLDPFATQALFRVAQEALVNIHRHAAATHIAIRVALTQSGIRLRIIDNGRGLSAAQSRQTDSAELGVGIPGMRERVESLGGHLAMQSGPNGTEVVATVPLRGVLGDDQIVSHGVADKIGRGRQAKLAHG